MAIQGLGSTAAGNWAFQVVEATGTDGYDHEKLKNWSARALGQMFRSCRLTSASPESTRDNIADAIERLLVDEALGARLREAGRAQAARFTWEATARGTLASYERALAEARR